MSKGNSDFLQVPSYSDFIIQNFTGLLIFTDDNFTLTDITFYYDRQYSLHFVIHVHFSKKNQTTLDPSSFD